MKKLKTIFISLLLLDTLLVFNPTNGVAQTQDNNEQRATETVTPLQWNSEQCVNNARTWLRSFPRDHQNLPHAVLSERVQALTQCEDRKDISEKNQRYILEAESCYKSELLIRELFYLQRHNEDHSNDDKARER
jgi:hypothetical protein